jgi:hypothetical protein
VLRLLDADADSADWRDVSRIVLHIDRTATPTARGERSKATSRAPDG